MECVEIVKFCIGAAPAVEAIFVRQKPEYAIQLVSLFP